jgi:hypothetical protein
MANSSMPSLAALADAPARIMDRSAMDYLLIELIPILRASSAVATKRAEQLEGEMIDAGLSLPPPPVPKRLDISSPLVMPTSAMGKSLVSPVPKGQPEEDEDALRRRLDAIGQHVGANIVER